MRKTKIVCTIGPASEQIDKLKQLINSGMNVARLNFSHGNYEEHAERIRQIRLAEAEVGKKIAILLDTQGPEIRTMTFKGGEAKLVKGKKVTICMDEVEGTSEHFSVTYDGLINDVHIGKHISL